MKRDIPLGIFVPKKIQKIIYPDEKIDYEKYYILATILRRLSVLISYYILNDIKAKPNHITLISITLCFFISYNFISGFFFIWIFIGLFVGFIR